VIQINEVRTPDRVFILQMSEEDMRTLLSAAIIAWNSAPSYEMGRRLADKLHEHLTSVRRIASDHKIKEL
jgi:hypothetical protein